MKAKNYKSITELLKQKYNKNFYDFEDFADVLLKIKKKARNKWKLMTLKLLLNLNVARKI